MCKGGTPACVRACERTSESASAYACVRVLLCARVDVCAPPHECVDNTVQARRARGRSLPTVMPNFAP
eukprot:1579609-Pleurochrysis_carterae.AAC.3